jgi:Flp pilus assembly protein TadD
VLRDRWHVHAALFATLGWLLYLAAGDPRGASAGLDSGVTWWQYLIIQATWWPRYAIGSLWPAWLCFDHGPVVQSQPLVTWGQFFPRVFVPLIVALAGLIVLGVRRPAAGWVMLTAAMVLAPSSSVVPIATEALADHRGYLPRAAVLALVVVWAHGVAQARWSRALAVGVWVAWVVGFSAMTVRYNELLRDPVALWQDVVRKYPLNARASNNLGQALIDYRGDEQHLREAIVVLRGTDSLSPGDTRVLNNLALAHARLGESDAAIAIYSDALAVDPRNATVLNNRGALYRDLGRDDDAMTDFAAALQAEPGHRRAMYNRAMLLLDRGDTAIAEAELRELTQAWPDYAHSHYGMGRVAESRGDWPAAIEAYERALQLNPRFAEARGHLENCLAQQRGDGD